jgi:esterase/lipase/1-acyl-sn-glycerol-3-phosphate acyltransferase
MFFFISLMLRVFNLHINLKNYNDTLKSGDIFLFNHFIRAETALPQYILYCADPNIKCYAVAHASFFKIWWLGPIVRKLGAIPHNHPRLMHLLTEKLSEGYKVVIFPQGRMVKDHEDVDMKTGSAVLALGTDLYKRHILLNKKDYSEELVEFATKPTIIVPCNISYYPLRITQNRVSIFGKKVGLPSTALEELIVEGNIILRDTEMNLNFGVPITIDSRHIDVKNVKDIPSAFEVLKPHREERFKLKDNYEETIYTNLTINHGHVFSEILFNFLEIEVPKVSRYQLGSAMEIACEDLGVDFSESQLIKLIKLAIECNLISEEDYFYIISENLIKEQPFKFVRMNNPLKVYRNELSPMSRERGIIKEAIRGSRRVSKRGFILHPDNDNGRAIVLLHGLFATADQCRPFAERLRDKGYSVYVPLVAGHGTSVDDLSKKTKEDWYKSVVDCLPRNTKFHIIGFSTGGLIAAKVAKEMSEKVLSLSCICTPHEFVSKGMGFIKLLKAIRFPKFWFNGENPDTYSLIPINTLCELQDFVSESKETFKDININTLITQTTGDPIVAPSSGEALLGLIGDNAKLVPIEADAHNIESSEDIILDFIGETNE